jgi:hypothetical protein
MTTLTEDIRIRPRATSRAKWLAAALLLVLAAAAALLLTHALSPADSKSQALAVEGPAQARFHLEYPRAWRPLEESQLAQLPSRPVAVLHRTDGHGTFVVTTRPALTTPLDRVAAGLKRRLGRQFTDFREIGAKLVTLHGTRALVYTFARTKTGTAQSVVVVPAGDHSFVLNAVLPPQSPQAAREVGAMVASFDPSPGAH